MTTKKGDPVGVEAKAILVVEDQDDVRATLRDILEADGYDVIEAVDGGQALELLETRPADLVITDIFMPEKDGIQTIIELRRKHPSIKIIAVSGGGHARNFEFLEFSLGIGAIKTLAKPLGRDQILQAVREALGGTA